MLAQQRCAVVREHAGTFSYSKAAGSANEALVRLLNSAISTRLRAKSYVGPSRSHSATESVSVSTFSTVVFHFDICAGEDVGCGLAQKPLL